MPETKKTPTDVLIAAMEQAEEMTGVVIIAEMHKKFEVSTNDLSAGELVFMLEKSKHLLFAKEEE